jgi:hypothetical protein
MKGAPSVPCAHDSAGTSRSYSPRCRIAAGNIGRAADLNRHSAFDRARQNATRSVDADLRGLQPGNPQVNVEHAFSVDMFDVMKEGMTPEQAIDKAFKRAEAIFAKYPIQQA